MFYLFLQISNSLPFASEWVPQDIETPEDLFKLLKRNTIYFNDSPQAEQLQKMPTLLGIKNIHGVPGAGDCDCFVITASACSLVLGFDTKIVLCGRSKVEPVHIYNIIDGQIFDLTRPYIGEVKHYPYKQVIPIK